VTNINDNDDDGVAEAVGRVGDDAAVWTIVSLPDGTVEIDAAPFVLDANATAFGINAFGDVCGHLENDAIVWSGGSSQILDASATVKVFGKRKQMQYEEARAINASGIICGYGVAAGYLRATVWRGANEPMTLLDDSLTRNSSFSYLYSANDVNEAGVIVGRGWNADIQLHVGYLAIPQ
jgi:hypothetical protein